MLYLVIVIGIFPLDKYGGVVNDVCLIRLLTVLEIYLVVKITICMDELLDEYFLY